MSHRSVLVCVICAAAVSMTGCYRSHTRADDPENDVPPGSMCLPPSPAADPLLVIEPLDHADRIAGPGTSGVRVLSFRLRNVADQWIEPAEFTVLFHALEGAFPSSSSPAFFRNARFLVDGLPTSYGPEDMNRVSETEGSAQLLNAWGTRPGHDYVFTLVVDVSPEAEGTFEIMVGSDRCHLLDRVWFVHEPDGALGDDVPPGRIVNNIPIVTRVTIRP